MWKIVKFEWPKLFNKFNWSEWCIQSLLISKFKLLLVFSIQASKDRFSFELWSIHKDQSTWKTYTTLEYKCLHWERLHLELILFIKLISDCSTTNHDILCIYSFWSNFNIPFILIYFCDCSIISQDCTLLLTQLLECLKSLFDFHYSCFIWKEPCIVMWKLKCWPSFIDLLSCYFFSTPLCNYFLISLFGWIAYP